MVMKRFTNISQINPIKRAITSFKIQTKQRLALSRHMRFIANQQSLFNQMQQANKYSDELSYTYRPFDLTTPHALHQFSFYSDQQIGGQSTGTLVFDRQEKALLLEGTISDKDKDKLTQYPSIGIARTHPFPIRCGPFNAINIQIDGDGQPMHLGVQISTKLSGVVNCYGIITSKIKGWRTYELPFVNMVLVGAQEHQQWNNGEQELYSTSKDGTTLGNNRTDMRRIIQTEADEVVLRDINLRLLGSKTTNRRVTLRSINLVRRAHSQRFIRDYLHPYFYMVEVDPYIVQRDVGVSWLTKGYQHFKSIDLGDKKYVNRQTQSSRRSN